MYALSYMSGVGKRVTISSARKELFELFDEVTTKQGAKVVIGHRDSPRDAVLVSRDYLEDLEKTSRELRRAAAATSFTLFGSATLVGDPEDVLKDVRADARERAEVKLSRPTRRERSG